VRWLIASVAVHALLLLAWGQTQLAPPMWTNPKLSTQVVEVVSDPPPVFVDLVGGGGGGGGGGRAVPAPRAARIGHVSRADPFGEMSIGVEGIDGRRTGVGDGGDGGGHGGGHGRGIGFGDGGGIATTAAVPRPPAPPPPPPPSKARPARLVFPTRDREVDDDDDLFVARVTVDTDGAVVGVHMVTTHPGVRGDQADSAIWTFRYEPALDDAGQPVRSTFEQSFQIR
jgi:hypothetical protein